MAKEHSAEFEKLNIRYGRRGCTKEQLARFVVLKVITPEEYAEITGESYGS